MTTTTTTTTLPREPTKKPLKKEEEKIWQKILGKKIFCFDWNGKLDDSVEINLGVDALHTSYRIAVLNDEFIISARRKLIVI